MRPAPLQLNWLAYPGTSGAPWMDAVIGDSFVLPPSLEAHYSERVLRLPRAFQPSDNTRLLEPAPSRAECGLPEQGVVFCCFNNSYKLNPRSMGRAFAVLQAVHGDARACAIELADRLLGIIGEAYDLDGHRAIVETSIGIVLAPEHALVKEITTHAQHAAVDAYIASAAAKSELERGDASKTKKPAPTR